MDRDKGGSKPIYWARVFRVFWGQIWVTRGKGVTLGNRFKGGVSKRPLKGKVFQGGGRGKTFS